MLNIDLTTEEVASALRLNRATVQRMLKTGRLKGYQIGRAWRVPTVALDDFRGYNTHSVGSQNDNPPFPKPVSVVDDYEAWERVLLNDENLACVPAIPAEAMRRENMYEGRD